MILELIKPNRLGEVGDNAPITKMVGKRIKYRLEELVYWQGHQQAVMKTYEKMVPDILVTTSKTKTYIKNTSDGGLIVADTERPIAIELETDINWDFGKSLRQIKKYRKKFTTIVIIPKKYERFAPLYINAGFRVYLWEATRVWKCMRCGKITPTRKTLKPKCSDKGCNSTEQRLSRIKDATFELVTS